jgi:hypothetical protein
MPDQLEELFAELRADTLPRVRPPGTGAARETVRRRRTTRQVAVAAALLTVAGGATATGISRHEADNRPQAAGRSDKQAAQRAVSGLGDRKADGLVGDSLPVTFPDLPAGGYTLAITCAGRGVLTMRLALRRDQSGPEDLGGQVVSCATDPQPATMVFRLPDDGVLSLSVEGDAQADDGAAYALALQANEDDGNAEEPSQQSLGNADRAFKLLTASNAEEVQSMTTEQGGQVMTTGVVSGQYQLRLACAGPGVVSFKMEQLITENGKPDNVGETLAEETIDCIDVDPKPYDGFITIDMPKVSGYLVTVDPDEEARNRAGVAWALLA